MSTRSMVARKTENNGFIGRYIHWDGYISGVGLSIMYAVEHFGFEKAVSVLLDEHPAGWSGIAGCDWSLPVGNISIDRKITGGDHVDTTSNDRGAECGCHGDHPSDENLALDHNSDWGCEFAYVFDEAEKTMTVYDKRGSADGNRTIGMFGMPAGGNWYPLTKVNFNNKFDLVDQTRSLLKCCEVAKYYEEQEPVTVS